MNTTFFCSFANGKAVQHAINVLNPYVKVFTCSRHDGIGCNNKRFATIFTDILLSTVFSFAVANNVSSTTNRANATISKPFFCNKLFNTYGFCKSFAKKDCFKTLLISGA